jgi:hypothetical protein
MPASAARERMRLETVLARKKCDTDSDLRRPFHIYTVLRAPSAIHGSKAQLQSAKRLPDFVLWNCTPAWPCASGSGCEDVRRRGAAQPAHTLIGVLSSLSSSLLSDRWMALHDRARRSRTCQRARTAGRGCGQRCAPGARAVAHVDLLHGPEVDQVLLRGDADDEGRRGIRGACRTAGVRAGRLQLGAARLRWRRISDGTTRSPCWWRHRRATSLRSGCHLAGRGFAPRASMTRVPVAASPCRPAYFHWKSSALATAVRSHSARRMVALVRKLSSMAPRHSGHTGAIMCLVASPKTPDA